MKARWCPQLVSKKPTFKKIYWPQYTNIASILLVGLPLIITGISIPGIHHSNRVKALKISPYLRGPGSPFHNQWQSLGCRISAPVTGDGSQGGLMREA